VAAAVGSQRLTASVLARPLPSNKFRTFILVTRNTL
jgi:hypothetical protein